MSYKRILIALDHSPIAAHACEKGLEIATCMNAQVGLVVVLDPSQAAIPDSTLSMHDSIVKQRKEAETLFESIAAETQLKPFHFTPEGQPAKQILATAEEWHADLIVMGSHGRAGIKRMLLGSVAEEVARHAHFSVLIVPAKANGQ